MMPCCALVRMLDGERSGSSINCCNSFRSSSAEGLSGSESCGVVLVVGGAVDMYYLSAPGRYMTETQDW